MSQGVLVVGSKVQLISGGPVMTVIAVGPCFYGEQPKIRVLTDEVLAMWFDGSKQQKEKFPIGALNLVS